MLPIATMEGQGEAVRTRAGKAVIFMSLLVAIRTETKEGKIISQTNTQGVEKRRRENEEYEAVKFSNIPQLEAV